MAPPAMSSGLNVALPPDVTSDTLRAAVEAHAAPLEGSFDFSQPSSELITATYTALTSLLAKYNAEVQAREAGQADVESQLNESERSRAEADARASAALRERDEAQQDRMQSQTTLSEREAELAAIKANLESGNSASMEVKAVLEKEQREKRSILEVLDKERSQNSSLSEEVDVLKTQARESRQEANKLAAEVQEARASEGSAKFKIQSLQQELELAQKDASWAHSELSRSNSEQAAFRSSKHADIVKLQSELDSNNQTLTSLEAKVHSLQQAYDDNARRLAEATSTKEDLLTRLATQEESFRREMETKNRLVGLLERRAEDASRRVEQVEGAWEKVLEECRDREEELRGEIDAGRRSAERLEQEKQDLQSALDKLAETVGIDTSRDVNAADAGARAATPSTPSLRPFASNLGFNPALSMSPAASMAASLQRSGKSFTEVYTALAKTEEELRRERVESSRLASVLEAVMADLEERAPSLQAQREETERLAAALEELSADFARACEERDIVERECKQSTARSSALQRENDLQAQQLADLGRQVRHLTREIIVRDDPSAAARLQDEGQPIAMDGSDESSTQQIITTQLVTFDSLSSLIAQNGRLLRVSRELGAKMEEEEAKWRERNEREEGEAVQEAMQAIERLESEIHSERAKLEALRRERDMFRSMLASGARETVAAPTASADTNAANTTLANQYSALQSQFDSFREETARDASALKDEARLARDEAGKSALSAAREKASREAGEDRLRSLQQTFELQRNEVNELSRRLRSQHDNLARLETSSHTFSEQLVSARNELERLRNENANLRAERELFKGTETRLTEDLSAQVKEKAVLSALLRNVQTMQNELDRNAGETKRRLEGQVEKLEEQYKQTRDRYDQEAKARRENDLRHDVESQSMQSRIEKANADLATAREQLAVAKTSVEHLTRRSEDLQKQVDSREEKLAVYERRSGASGGSSSTAPSTSLDNSQQLQIELAELRGELRSAQVEAEQGKSHVEQFKAIAQASEDALRELQTTYDEYKASTESKLSQSQTEATQLRERLESVATEITTLQNEASTARQAMEAQRNEFAAEKRSLEDALTELGSVEQRAKAEQQDVRAEVEQHARLAREAHAKYESELMAHADDIRALSTLKEELEKSRTEAREAQTAAESAQANLSGSEASWASQREGLTKDRDAAQQRLTDLNEQNRILHEHLEKLTTQVAQIRQTSGGENPSAAEAADGDASFSAAPTDELQEVVRYLRREREIADLQVDLNKQEASRLRQSLEHVNRTLEETRLQLADERQRNASSGGPGAAKQHDDLLEKINQLSILRESNATLRDETEKAQRKANQLQTQLNLAQSEAEPLKEQVKSAQNELSAAQGQLRIVQEDNQRWQARAQSILAQYDRVDPEEVKRLEEKAAQGDAKAAELQGQIDATRAELATSRERFQKLRTQAHERIEALRADVARLSGQSETLSKEKEALTSQLESASGSSESALSEVKQELLAAQEEAKNAREAVTAGETKVQSLEKQIEELQTAAKDQMQGGSDADAASEEKPATGADEAVAAALAEAQKAWDEEKAALQQSRTQLEAREKQHHQKARDFLKQMKVAQEERDEVKKELQAKLDQEATAKAGDAATDAPPTTSTEAGAALNDEAEALKKRIAELEEALEKANARIAELEAGSGASPDMEALKTRHAEELKEQQTQLAQQYQKRQSMAVEVAVKKAQAAAGAGGGDVEQQIQERLKSVEEERNQAQAAAIASAVQAKEKELRELLATPAGGEGAAGTAGDEEALKARYEAGYTAGKNEASLRNQLLIKQKDGKIAKLTSEIAELKGEGGSGASGTAASAAPGNGPLATGSARGGSVAGARGGRGGAASATSGGLPVRPPSGPQTQQGSAAGTTAGAGSGAAARGGRGVARGMVSVRGAGRGASIAGRGGARGGGNAGNNTSGGTAPSAAGGPSPGAQKRKVSEDGANGAAKKAKGDA